MKAFAVLLLLVAMQASLRAQEKAAPAPTPSRDATAAMERRANQAMNRGQYSMARDLFARVAERVKDDPRRLAIVTEQIRMCDVSIKKILAAMPAVAPDPKARAVTTADDKRAKHPAPKDGEVYATTIRELGNFDYDPDAGGAIPADVKRLDGATVRLRGFMSPVDQVDRVTRFTLVPSYFDCCFGRPPQIQHQVDVRLPEGKALDLTRDEIVCEGTLRVRERRDEGYIVSVFDLQVMSVKAAE